MVDEQKITDIDVLVIGGGLAAAFAAIKAKEKGAERVVQVCKGRTGCTGNSAFAAKQSGPGMQILHPFRG